MVSPNFDLLAAWRHFLDWRLASCPLSWSLKEPLNATEDWFLRLLSSFLDDFFNFIEMIEGECTTR